MTPLYWNPSTLILPMGSGAVRLHQAYDRRNVLTNLAGLAWIDGLIGGSTVEAASQAYVARASTIRWADATTYTLWDHAYANPDFFDRSVTPAEMQQLPWEETLELLTEARILLDQWPPPTDSDKRHFSDRFRGNFFEQIATESLFNRTTPAAWWTAQKFLADRKDIRQTPYKFIEERFLERYFAQNFAGKEVLEIGAGTGYFTAKIARRARVAVGMDYNADYLKTARDAWPATEYPNLDFRHGNIIDLAENGGEFANRSFDFVVLIDTFLFLFDPRFQPDLYRERTRIMENFRRLVRPGGLLLVMDPHPLWLTPWFGGPTNPVGIVSEYRHRRLRVIPTIEEMVGFLFESGMRLRRVLEPDIDDEYRKVDPQAAAFMHEVPQWWFLEIEVRT